METHTKIWTYADLEAMDGDGKRYEILDGELFEMSAPTARHQRLVGKLYLWFCAQLEETKIARVYMSPLDVIMSPSRVVQPDVIVIRKERLSIVKERIEGAPDLVVEILSPSNTKHDRVTKRRFYARNGIREYWIVDPEAQSIEVLELIPDGLTYRAHGFYDTGDHDEFPSKARGATLPIEIVIDALFREDD